MKILFCCVTFSKCIFESWIKIRQYRITVFRVYKIYTYMFNRNPDWKKKSLSYFYSKTFHRRYIAHRKKFKWNAIDAYKNIHLRMWPLVELLFFRSIFGCHTLQMGSSWKSRILTNLYRSSVYNLEKKEASKIYFTHSNFSTLKTMITFKHKHEDYCQMQINMAVLNVNSTDFNIYL